jgi:hypothetical protein
MVQQSPKSNVAVKQSTTDFIVQNMLHVTNRVKN